MTLRRKMAYQIAAMIVGLLLVSGAALWGMRGLRQDYGVAVRGYEQLREVYRIGSHLETARTLLGLSTPDRRRAATEVASATTRLELLAKDRLADHASVEFVLHARLREAGNRLHDDTTPAAGGGGDASAVSAALGPLSDLAAGIRRDIEAGEAAAGRRLRTTTLATAAVCAGVILGAVLLGVWQYGGVVRPLQRLGAGVRRVAAGAFAERIEPDPRGAEEFRALAADFNRMAGELDSFTRDLEQKVAVKSKELIRSERLASVGYLAAGVAHEINNPLGIITGYAELALAKLKRADGAPAADGDAALAETLRVICDEAFRCKEITAKLLGLARQGDEGRARVDLADVARQVAAAVAGLRQFDRRRLAVRAEAGADLSVFAVEGELRQVVMNLVINALEAVDERTEGEAIVTVARDGDVVELAVADNGRGMTPQTVERAFEPFYTEKRGRRHTGTGLGLSITHAIVESHGGRITAASDGPAKGSRFVVRLPAAAAEMKREGAKVAKAGEAV
jgi:signal transduction histidine kinase